MNNNIDLKKTEKMGYISFWCQKVIPLVFDDSLSYYEAICKFMQKLNEVISALNNNAECIDELQDKYIILQKNFDALEEKWKEFQTYIENEFNTFKTEITTKVENFETTINNEFTSFKNYVENYLNNIDVQRYVYIKIDELAESGYFSTLLTNLGFNPDNFLAKNNTTVYVPTDDYNPATKKYVDEHSSEGTVYSAGDGIKIIDGTISTTNYNAENNDKNGITITGCTIIGKDNNINSNDRNSIFGNNNTIGENITNSIIVGDQNDITGTSSFHNSNIIIGRQNTANNTHQTITLGNNNNVNELNHENIILIGHNCGTIKEVNENTEGSIIISNGTTHNNHNAIVITRTQNDGTLGNIHTFNKIMGHRETKDWTELDRDKIYPLPYEIDVKIGNEIEIVRNEFMEFVNNISNQVNQGELPINFENNITGEGLISFTKNFKSPVILYVKFTHPGKATESADTEFKVGTIDLGAVDKVYIPRYINAFVNNYPCVISLRTTNDTFIYDVYYDGNAIPESIGATNFIVKCNQIIGFRH